MESKSFLKSKTIWYNIIMGIATFTGFLTGTFTNRWLLISIVLVNAFANTALRFITIEPIKTKKKDAN